MNRHEQRDGRRSWILWSCAAVLLVALTGLAVVRGAVQSSEQPAAADVPTGGHAVRSAPPAPQPAPAGVTPAALAGKCPQEAVACVDEGLRVSWLQHDGKITYGPVPIMPGTEGLQDSTATPKGVFRVLRKDAHHVSSEFGEPMNNSVFFAPGGIAFHEGSLVDTSHGCVHLSPAASQQYFQELQKGAVVAVF